MRAKTDIVTRVVLLAGMAGCGIEGAVATPKTGADAGGGASQTVDFLVDAGGATGKLGGNLVPGIGDAGGSLTDPTLNRCNWNVEQTTCAGNMYSGQTPPIDIFIMFDQSGSMGTKDDGTIRRIDAVRSALNQFLQAPESHGIGAGIGFFGFHPLACACTSCNPNDYTKPTVAVADLPGNAGALASALAGIEPTGETPTGAALRGACAYVRTVLQERSGRQLAVLLVTDGEPQAPLTSAKGICSPTLADAMAAAAECLKASPAVRTFVLGVGPSLQNLKHIASSGGTGSAYLAESGGGDEVLRALNQIRRDAQIPCTLELPRAAAGALDLNTVNVIYGDTNCTVTTFVKVESAAVCTVEAGGWYYENPSKPTAIKLCDSTCKQVSQPNGQLRISVGCQTKIIP